MSFFDNFDPVIRASRSDDSQRFLEILVNSSVWFIGAPAIDGVEPKDPSPEALAAFVEQAAAASRNSEMKPWAYEVHGKLSLPFFTSQKLLKTFLKSYVAEVNRIIPFQIGQLRFLQLLPFVLAADAAELNPRSNVSRSISADERAVLEGVVSGLSEGVHS
ncbi:MAG: hypothetical protein IT456_12700 [Planctomycetes bacterium]|nr:hypothetical protein [Planctomycetota bacterium]